MISLAQSEAPEYGAYPYGMRLMLDDDVLEKLGITQMPAAGTRLSLKAVAMVVETRAEPDSEGEVERCVCLQITDIELGAAPSAAITVLYGDD